MSSKINLLINKGNFPFRRESVMQLSFSLFIKYLSAKIYAKHEHTGYFIYYSFTAQVLKVCRTPGLTDCLKLLQKVCLKRWRKEKNP